MNDLSILFIHGFPFDGEMWRRQVDVLSHRWACVVPTLWGAGSANIEPTAPEHSMAEHAHDLIERFDGFEVSDVVVCGFSMGGYVAFELLRVSPERIRGLILCNTKATADTPDAKRGRDVTAAKAEREGVGAIAAELVPKLLARVTRERRPEIVREVTAMIERQPRYGIVRTVHALRDRADSTPLLSQIRIPVLVIAGDDDQITPAAGMREMGRAISGSEFVLVPEAGHLTPIEQPDVFNHAVERFVARL